MRLRTRKERLRLLDEAFGRGIRHYDVARSYGLGGAEADVGRFAKGKRDELYIATKFGLPLPRAAAALRLIQGPIRAAMAQSARLTGAARTTVRPSDDRADFHGKIARRSLEVSMRALKVDYVDLYLMHEPAAGAYDADEVAAYMAALCERGLVRRWGVAGEPGPLREVAAELSTNDLVVQTRWNLTTWPLPAIARDAHIVYGVLATDLPRILAHTAQSDRTRRRWNEEVGADCGDSNAVSALLLEIALRDGDGRRVLMSTTQRQRLSVVDVVNAHMSQPHSEGAARLRRLIEAEVAVRKH